MQQSKCWIYLKASKIPFILRLHFLFMSEVDLLGEINPESWSPVWCFLSTCGNMSYVLKLTVWEEIFISKAEPSSIWSLLMRDNRLHKCMFCGLRFFTCILSPICCDCPNIVIPNYLTQGSQEPHSDEQSWVKFLPVAVLWCLQVQWRDSQRREWDQQRQLVKEQRRGQAWGEPSSATQEGRPKQHHPQPRQPWHTHRSEWHMLYTVF